MKNVHLVFFSTPGAPGNIDVKAYSTNAKANKEADRLAFYGLITQVVTIEVR